MFCFMMSELILTGPYRPLHPGTCQSTEMQFMALSPGVHSIDALVLTDVNFNYSLNLRYVACICRQQKFHLTSTLPDLLCTLLFITRRRSLYYYNVESLLYHYSVARSTWMIDLLSHIL
jgi:hypothetical protein